jgi:hypothetical protein
MFTVQNGLTKFFNRDDLTEYVQSHQSEVRVMILFVHGDIGVCRRIYSPICQRGGYAQRMIRICVCAWSAVCGICFGYESFDTFHPSKTKCRLLIFY